MDTYAARLVAVARTAACAVGVRTRLDGVISLVWLWCALFLLWPLVRWALVDAVWFGPASSCHPGGACWPYVSANMLNLLYGPLPRFAIPRMNLELLVILIGVVVLVRNHKNLAVWLVVCCLQPVSVWLLLHGGFFGLEVVSTQYWGGYSLNLLVSIMSIAMAFPLSLLLVLLRQSDFFFLSRLGRFVIGYCIGVPLLVHLFFATLVLPLFFVPAWMPSKMVRVVGMLTLFGASYMAEVIRGGLQAIPKAQHEAADSLGLSVAQKMVTVILPQAIQSVFPGLVNLVVALFKDSVLISTIAMLDILAMMQSTVANVTWMPYFVEGYLFVGLLFWAKCVALSRIASRMEKRMEIKR